MVNVKYGMGDEKHEIICWKLWVGGRETIDREKVSNKSVAFCILVYVDS